MRTDVYKALPYEKVKDQGLGRPWILFMAFRLSEASSSDWPPERKVTPGRAPTIVLDKVLTVYQAISSALALFGQEAPGVTMLGFKRRPSIKRFCLNSSYMTAEKTRSDTSAQTSIS